MKKTYVQPGIEVIRLKMEQLLAADSLQNNSEETVTDINDVLGNEVNGSLWGDDDEY